MLKKKEKNQHGVISNVFFLLKIMFRISPGLVIGEILTDIITTLPDRLISVIGIKYVIDQIDKPDGIRKIFIALAIIIFDDASLWFLGMSFVVIGIISLYLINH